MKRKTDRVKQMWKVLVCLLIVAVVGATAVFGINSYVKMSVRAQILSPEEATQIDSDCILVLGAGVRAGRPSHMLEDRLLQGIQLYEKGASSRLIMSGDHGRKEYDEVNVMKQFAIDAGIPSKQVFMDHAGFSTYESLYRARDIFQAKKIIIVTQEYHLYRALYIAKKLGIEANGVASDLRGYAGQEYRDAREILARAKDFFYVMVKPEPTYLGDAIPINSNGDLTND
ncbi:MAG: SanA protein [Anaerosolibacter sp.]|jgi:vancomycin permeability regulator SanA|uniref:SanA/YdcF family protein n=1 Tax=Anaerosolibacter sp. TaxID=1872527 RepID=UPI0026191A1D|nr:ElyC/SanA/YdcF family protein [Anaerosolibacter sp.]MDF2548536.1 SanA protein [Anaerosolibacter sp.]